MRLKAEDKLRYYEFLDALRLRGVTNMFGAVPYLREEFPELDQKQAKGVHATWIRTFGERQKRRG